MEADIRSLLTMGMKRVFRFRQHIKKWENDQKRQKDYQDFKNIATCAA